MITGKSERARIQRQSERPSTPGSIRASTTRLGDSRSSRARAVSQPPAVDEARHRSLAAEDDVDIRSVEVKPKASIRDGKRPLVADAPRPRVGEAVPGQRAWECIHPSGVRADPRPGVARELEPRVAE